MQSPNPPLSLSLSHTHTHIHTHTHTHTHTHRVNDSIAWGLKVQIQATSVVKHRYYICSLYSIEWYTGCVCSDPQYFLAMIILNKFLFLIKVFGCPVGSWALHCSMHASLVVGHRLQNAQAQELWPTGLVALGSMESCFPDQGSNPHLLHGKADSLPLNHQGSPLNKFLNSCFLISPIRKMRITSLPQFLLMI